MRQLLEERTTLCFQLGLSSRNGRSNQVDRQQMQKFFGELFKDCPDNLSQLSWTIVQDRGTVYGFLASEDKFVPICKACSFSVYVSLRGDIGRIVCSNFACKFELRHKSAHSAKHQSFLQSRLQQSKNNRKSELLDPKSESSQLNQQDRDLIKKAAKRFLS